MLYLFFEILYKQPVSIAIKYRSLGDILSKKIFYHPPPQVPSTSSMQAQPSLFLVREEADMIKNP
jgi:hypothetical protein